MLQPRFKLRASLAHIVFAVAGTALPVACAANEGNMDVGSRGGSSGTSGKAGSSGAAGSSGSAAGGSSGAGGTVSIDSGSGSGGSGGLTPDAACNGISVATENKVSPADVVMAVDQSSSMADEAPIIQQQIADFAQQLAAKGVDVQLVLVAERPTGVDAGAVPSICTPEESFIENPLCVPTPIGGPKPECGDNLPTYRSVNCHVDSTNALEILIATHDVYKPSLRADSVKHVVVITDDSTDLSTASFDTQLKAKDPALWNGYFFHAIVPFTDCPFSAGDSSDYRAHVQKTGGIEGDLCTQDFKPLWDKLTDHVTVNTKLACEWDIPPAPPGQQFDPEKVNVQYSSGGVTKDLGRVDSPADCATFKDAWYYDDPVNPTRILVCPELCAAIQNVSVGTTQQMDILFGCKSTAPVPK